MSRGPVARAVGKLQSPVADARRGSWLPTADRLSDEVQGLARAVVVRARQPLQRFRVLPDFLVIGAQRGGTTSLYRYLGSHPDLVPSLGKEVQFFSLYWCKGVPWYRSHFPLVHHLHRGGRKRQAFEASPYYIFHPHAARRAATVLPHAKVLALLRDPVERAYSHYLHNVRLGLEPLSFEDAVDAEPRRIGGERERMLNDSRYSSLKHRRYSYVDRGRYAEQLRVWLAHFPDSMMVVKSEDFYAGPAATLDSVLNFLSVEPYPMSEFKQYTKRKPECSEMAPATRKHLAELFVDSNAQLSALLGRDLRWDQW